MSILKHKAQTPNEGAWALVKLESLGRSLSSDLLGRNDVHDATVALDGELHSACLEGEQRVVCLLYTSPSPRD